MRTFRNAYLLAGAALFGLAGCETIPTHIEGRRVVGVTKVEGQRAYIVESAEGDRIITRVMAAESRAASKGVVFEGTNKK